MNIGLPKPHTEKNYDKSRCPNQKPNKIKLHFTLMKNKQIIFESQIQEYASKAFLGLLVFQVLIEIKMNVNFYFNCCCIFF